MYQEGEEPGEDDGVDDREGGPAASYLSPQGGDGGDTGEIEQDEQHEAESRGRREDALLTEGGGQEEVGVVVLTHSSVSALRCHLPLRGRLTRQSFRDGQQETSHTIRHLKNI